MCVVIDEGTFTEYYRHARTKVKGAEALFDRHHRSNFSAVATKKMLSILSKRRRRRNPHNKGTIQFFTKEAQVSKNQTS